jgi:hypothetical protein
MTREELLPCPLCNGKSDIIFPDTDAEIFCTECDLTLESRSGETINQLKSRWNKRIPAQCVPSPPEPYWLPFKVVGGCIRDAKDNYVAELSSPFGGNVRDAMAAFLVAAANTFSSAECGEGK